VGTAANQILQLNPSAQIPAVDGSLLTGVVHQVNSGTGLLGGPINGIGTLRVDVGTAANQILQLDASAKIPAVDGSQLTNIKATKLQNTPVSATAPTASQVLQFNNTTAQWEAQTLPPGVSSSGAIKSIQVSDGAGGFMSNSNIIVDTVNDRVGIGTTTP